MHTFSNATCNKYTRDTTTGTLELDLAHDPGDEQELLFGGIARKISRTATRTVRKVGKTVGKTAKASRPVWKTAGKVVKSAHRLTTPAGVVPLARFGRDLARGKNVWRSVRRAGWGVVNDVRAKLRYARIAAPFVPGVGTGVAAALGAADALASGRSITDAAIAAARSAVPGGAIAQTAFDVGLNLAQGRSLSTAALAAARRRLPGGPAARAAFDTAVALGRGKSLQAVARIGTSRIIPRMRLFRSGAPHRRTYWRDSKHGMLTPELELGIDDVPLFRPIASGDLQKRYSPIEYVNEPTILEAELEQVGWMKKTKRGNQNHIKWIQQSLNKIVQLKLKIDGVMGPQTRAAIRSFQKKQGLVVDGIVGPKTDAALKASLKSISTPVQSREWQWWILDRFEFSKSSLTPVHYLDIRTIAAHIKSQENTANAIQWIDFLGHTDPVGTSAKNYLLGCKRAWSVAKELKRILGVSLSQRIVFRIASLGEEEPVMKFDNSVDVEASRRVDVSLYVTEPPVLHAKSVRCDDLPGKKVPSRTKGYLTVQANRTDSRQPIIGLSVAVRRILPTGWTPPLAFGQTNANGQKEVGPLEPGRYEIILFCRPRYKSDDSRQVTINAGQKITVKFSCDPKPLPWPPEYPPINWEEKFTRHYDPCVNQDFIQSRSMCPTVMSPLQYSHCRKPPSEWPNNPKLRKLLYECCPELHQKRVDSCVKIEVREELHRERPSDIPKNGWDPIIQNEYRKWKNKHGKPD